MKKLQRRLWALGLSFCIGSQAMAQSDMADMMKGSMQDAGKLLKAYVSPFGESFGVNMNSGWVNTAAPLKPGRFELKLVGNMSFVPMNRKTYNLDALGFREPVSRSLYGEPATEQWEYNNPVAPTIFGVSDETATIRKTLTYTDPVSRQETTETIAELPLPQGIGIGVNPLPFVPQLSVGLPMGTEVMVRYLPGVNIGSGQSAFAFNGLWGLGVKHNIKQWIPVISKLPFSLSAVAGYTASSAGLEFAPMVPEAPGSGSFADPLLAGTAYTGPALQEADYQQQGVTFSASAWNVSLLASKRIPFLSAFGGLRYARSKTNITMTGVYGVAGEPYINEDNPSDPNNYRYTLIQTEKNPLKVDMPAGQIGLVGGFRLKLGIMSIFAEGTWSRYSTVSAGFGFGWFN